MKPQAEAVVVLQDAFWQAGEILLYHHTNPWELDEALAAWGYAMGPCEAQDLLGLEKVLARASVHVTPVLPRMVAEGRMGKGGGVGYYRYPGGGGAVIDPLIEDLILEEAWFGKVTRTELSAADLVDRLHAALGAACLSLIAQGMLREAVLDALVAGVYFPRDQGLAALTMRS